MVQELDRGSQYRNTDISHLFLFVFASRFLRLQFVHEDTMSKFEDFVSFVFIHLQQTDHLLFS
jgi:hypothetical protein